jgi:hypothetical protein
MGHVEPGGAAGAPALNRPGPLSHPAWPLWLAYKRHFRSLTLISDSFTTPGAMSWFGNDLVSGLRRNPSTRKAFELFADVPPATFNAVSAIATLNQRRQELGFQMLLALYITVPVTIFVSAGEVFPDEFARVMARYGGQVIQFVGALILTVLGYLMSLWRARQMVQVLDLIRIERALEPISTVELRDQG